MSYQTYSNNRLPQYHCGGRSRPPVPLPGRPHNQFDTVVLKEAADGAEARAQKLLDTLICNTTVPRVVNTVHYVRQRLSSRCRSTQSAAAALTDTRLALADCRQPYLREGLADAERAIRDVLVWRVQLRVPLDSRELFLAKMEEAFGCDQLEKNVYSQIMHAHATVLSQFPGAFPSKTKLAVMKRGGPRPRRNQHCWNGAADAASDVSAQWSTSASSQGGTLTSSQLSTSASAQLSTLASSQWPTQDAHIEYLLAYLGSRPGWQ